MNLVPHCQKTRSKSATRDVKRYHIAPPGTAAGQQRFLATHLINSDMLTVPCARSAYRKSQYLGSASRWLIFLRTDPAVSAQRERC